MLLTVVNVILVIDVIVMIALVLLQSGKSAGLSERFPAVQSSYLENRKHAELTWCYIV